MKSSSDGIRSSAESNGTQNALSASVQVLPLPIGFYMFSVVAAPGVSDTTASRLQLPAIHVALGPGVDQASVDFMGASKSSGCWLFSKGDVLLVRVSERGTTLVITSVRTPGEDALSIRVEKLGGERLLGSAGVVAESDGRVMTHSSMAVDDGPVVANFSGDHVPLRVMTHIRTRGDSQFSDEVWAGRLGTGLWIEAFSILPIEGLSEHDIEYKGLTSSGFETPWLSAGATCGTKGMSVPLIGFAVRLRPSDITAELDCEYSGYFQSGTTSGPMRHGAPCRSAMNSDPLEGISIRITRRTGPALPGTQPEPIEATSASVPKPGAGPSFGRLREDAAAASAPSPAEALQRGAQNPLSSRGKNKK